MLARGHDQTPAPAPLEIRIGEPHVERVYFLWVQLGFDVQRIRAEQRQARANPQPPGVPLIVVALIGADGGEVVLEPAREQDPLDDGVRRVVVNRCQLLPDLVVDRACVRRGGSRLRDRRRLSHCRLCGHEQEQSDKEVLHTFQL